MINPNNINLSLSAQCNLVSISRSNYYYTPTGECDFNLNLMYLIDKEHTAHPWYGSRQMTRFLRREGYCISRKRVRRLMHKMGICIIYRKLNTSKPNPQHPIYPYLLRDIIVDKPNQVWCSDITYIPMYRGFMYLVAVMDWFSRKVLSWKLSNSLEADFCVEAVVEAVKIFGKPNIFNTDQGSQYSSSSFTELLNNLGVQISMDGKGRWMDNIFIERLWRSLKYECIYLHEFSDGFALQKGIKHWVTYYNQERPHSTFAGQTPDEVYNPGLPILVKKQQFFNNRILS